MPEILYLLERDEPGHEELIDSRYHEVPVSSSALEDIMRAAEEASSGDELTVKIVICDGEHAEPWWVWFREFNRETMTVKIKFFDPLFTYNLRREEDYNPLRPEAETILIEDGREMEVELRYIWRV